MIIERVKLQGFISFIDEDVDFSQNHIVLISGPNGEGKSALLEAIPWCYWGKGRGKTASDYINDNCETAHIEVTCSQDDVRYKKVRQVGKAGSINELYVDEGSEKWKLISDDTKRKTDKLWSEIIGLDYEIFSNSVFFGQKEVSSFIDGTASDRKELLCNLLNAEIYEKAEDAAKKQANKIDDDINIKYVVLKDKQQIAEQLDEIKNRYKITTDSIKVNKKNIDIIEEKLVDARKKKEKISVDIANQKRDKEQLDEIEVALADTIKRKKNIEIDLSKTEEDLESTINDGVEEVENLQKILEGKAKLEKSLKNCNAALEKLDIEKKKIPQLKESLDAQRKTKEQLVVQKSESNTKIEALNDKKARINNIGAICPVIDEPCERLTNKKELIQTIDAEINTLQKSLDIVLENLEFTSEQIIEIDGKLVNISRKVENEGQLMSNISSHEKDLKLIDDVEKKLPKIKSMHRDNVDKLQIAKEKTIKQLEEVKKEYDKLQLKQEKLQKNIGVDHEELLKTTNKLINACNEDIDELKDEQKQLTMKLGQLTNSLSQAKEAKSYVKQIQYEINESKKQYRIYLELVQAFGKNGIQKQIISNVVPLLEAQTNELLKRFTKNSDFYVKFDLDPVTKSGKLKKQGGLDIIISDHKSSRLLDMYSGGETVRIVFAILLSLSNLLTNRAGKRSQTLIIDERIAALDTEGINQFIEIVKYIASQYKKIMVVSHIDQLKYAFSEQIVVKNDAELGSKIEYEYN